MKLFFTYITKIFLITCLTGFSIQYFSDHGLRNLKNSNYNDWKNIIGGKINSQIIINGSSRGYVGYDPMIIGKALNLNCYNISYNAGGYNLQKAKLDIYLKNNKKPTIVIQNIDFAYFNKNTKLSEENQFIPFINNPDINSFITNYDSKFLYLKYIPLLKYNQELNLLKKGFLANISNSIDENMKTYQGYCPQNRDFKIDYNNLNKNYKENKFDNQNRLKLLNEMVNYYYLRLGKEANVILVWAPEYKLRLNEDFEKERNSLITEINLIQKKHKNFHFIDLAHDEMSNNSKFYYDTFHLNQLGATVFSNKVAVKINFFLN